MRRKQVMKYVHNVNNISTTGKSDGVFCGQ